MKVRSSPRTGRTVVELGRGEVVLPAVPSPGIRLTKILVPVDFSECSSKALQYAVSFAKQFNAEILLLHVVQPPLYLEGTAMAMPGISEEDSRMAAAKHLSQWRSEVESMLDVKTSVRTGTPYHEIILAAEETNTDLILIGTHGRSRLARMLIGSTAERVVRHAPCPVMVVRTREHVFVVETETAAAKRSGAKRSRQSGRV